MGLHVWLYCGDCGVAVGSEKLVGMIRINQIKIENSEVVVDRDKLRGSLTAKAAKILRIDKGQIGSLEIIRHSIDARKKPEIFHIYMIDVELKGLDESKVLKKCRDKNATLIQPERYDFERMVEIAKDRNEKLSNQKNIYDSDSNGANDVSRIVIVGAGPAGLFCGYELAKHGYKPIILERGADVDKRTEIVEHFWKTGELDLATNVQFGEGGAGTFSDGKLNTMVKDKDGRGREALRIFVENGAKEDILYEAKPHIGTDILRNVVRNMRLKIIEWGGEVLFDTQVTDIVLDGNGQVTGVKVAKNNNSDLEVIDCSFVVLAIGHSARDTFYMLKDKNVDMAPKPFAVGFRVEHPQKLINLSQYGLEESEYLPAAPYKLTATTDEGRGVYSFCMCPGGYVVNASSEEGMLAVNGMSYSWRDGKNANSAIIITVDPKDFGGDDVLSGVEFQRRLEKKAYELGNGKIPVEYYGDFKSNILNNCKSDADSDLNNGNGISANMSGSCYLESFDAYFQDASPSMCGEYVFANVHEILPNDLNEAFVQGMERFGRIIKGYNNDKALVSGVESRTSSPVRINRDECGQSLNVKGLFPCGEGAGYAGGIMSAAMDGMKIAEFVAAIH